MSQRRLVPGWILALCALAPAATPQAAPRPQPYCIRGVDLDRAGEKKGTLLLRDGVIVAVLDAAAPAPPGTRVIDGTGLLCLPAFLDAFSRQGVSVPQPLKDQDLPPNLQADVGVDMRSANRKGIQPTFRAVDGLAITKEQAEAWRKSGFGAVLVAPGNELLSGASALASTREAAMRDVVVREEVFAHAAFEASGPGNPSTLMGYFAQLRQFFLDSQRQRELVQRHAQGRPGLRPPFDAQLAAGAAIVGGDSALLCEARESDDIQRWLRLADEFGFGLDVVGGSEAWRVADVLAERAMTVVLTLDWGKEAKDPRPKADAAAAEPAGEEQAQAAVPEEATAPAAEPDFEYEEPYAVRLERRLKWEQGRDCALRLNESGVAFVFGSAGGKPSELLERVRDLVVAGLPGDVALAALTDGAARFLGVERSLGRVEPGFDATFALWRSDPLTDKKASVAWIFVDGFPSEFVEEKKEKAGAEAGPAEGVDPSGTWELTFVVEGEGLKAATLRLEMEPDGTLSGTLDVENPMDGGRVQAEVEGQVTAAELELTCTLAFGQFALETTLNGTLAGAEIEGKGSFKGPWSEEPMSQPFTGKRKPQQGAR